MPIRLADSDEDLLACFPVMHQLRPQLVREQFVERVRLQQEQGYRMAMVEDGAGVRAVAGFRIVENLAWGRHMYVDDLVTDEFSRSAGHGQALFTWLTDYARQHGCGELHLDSGVQRFDAHRFYLRNRMLISSHHFSLRIAGDS